ncbi:MAG: 3-deoxy-manno-octulosonate cytidylyltransferase [Prolixibacteraceae bacterium]
MKPIVIIPARYHSSRFLGKPLALIHGKPMIQRVVEKVKPAVAEVWVATDHEEIASTVREFGGNVVMTSPLHTSGTDRCAEAARILSSETDFDVVINVQGDEPFISPRQIAELTACFTPGVQIVTLVRKIKDPDELANPNKPKVVIGANGDAIYFSRSVIPHVRGIEVRDWLNHHTFWAHVGLYGYLKDVLQEITLLPPGALETAESLEQLRWLENGYRIKVAETLYAGFGIDTPEDLARAMQLF